ncbi:MAG: YbaN family protein [Betaproteobacteria bacterium]|uniref:YbaN family protein n=1 Tax=Candidatus Proximibacter danicus TaxID=2954365 RepID=A0A9D7PQ82_9PROT|nr:YbaN family protein [Candidatus Proximibacter danicus]
MRSAPSSLPTESAKDAASRLHASKTVRWLLWTAGTISLVLGIIGVFLPVLPTTPFILLAAACYARASEKFHQHLLAHKTFGPTIRDWEEYRSLSLKTKKVAITMMTLSIAVSIWVVREHLWLQLILACIAVSVGTWMWRLPSRDQNETNSELSSPSSSADASR